MARKPLYLYIIASGMLWMLAIAACKEQKTNYNLTSGERAQIDTLYLNEINGLRPKLDSACAAQFDQMVQHALDSILVVRRQEEAKMRERIPRIKAENE